MSWRTWVVLSRKGYRIMKALHRVTHDTSPRFHHAYVWAALGFAFFINFTQAEGEKSIDSLIAKPSMNVVLSTSNVAEVKKFYGEALGLKPMTPLHLPGGLEMTRFLVGTSEIKFLPPRGSAPWRYAMASASSIISTTRSTFEQFAEDNH